MGRSPVSPVCRITRLWFRPSELAGSVPRPPRTSRRGLRKLRCFSVPDWMRCDVTDARRAPEDVIAKLGDIAASARLRRITMLAWRDLDDPEAGGSEIHASRVAELWGKAGIEVTMRTS